MSDRPLAGDSRHRRVPRRVNMFRQAKMATNMFPLESGLTIAML